MAALKPEFEKRNVKVIGLSVDSVADHEGWSKDIEEVREVRTQLPADRRSGQEGLRPLRHDPSRGQRHRHRAVGLRRGPGQRVKLTLTYPQSTGRNFDELLRVIDSLQLTAKYKVSTPSDWKQGEDVIIIPAVSDDEARGASRRMGRQSLSPPGETATGLRPPGQPRGTNARSLRPLLRHDRRSGRGTVLDEGDGRLFREPLWPASSASHPATAWHCWAP